MRILTVLGTRPEIVKLVPVLRAFAAHREVQPVLCHTGQHDTLGRALLEVAGIAVDEALARPDGAGGLDGLLAGMLRSIGEVIARVRPDAVVVQGDTASAFAGALAAFHAQVPIAHVEAGLRSGDLSRPFPEEGYRSLIAPLAHWHFAPTAKAAGALRAEGIAPARIFVTGNTVIDCLRWAEAALDRDPALAGEAQALLENTGGRPLALATVHRREHDPHALAEIGTALRALAMEDGLAVVLPAHPRPESRALLDALGEGPGICVVPPLDYFPFLTLMRAARLILTDSGGIQEEATALGRAALILRDKTERPEAIEAGAARLVGADQSAILTAARDLLARDSRAEPSDVFGDGRAAERIVETIAGERPQLVEASLARYSDCEASGITS